MATLDARHDERVFQRVGELRLGTPAWGYGNTGTRFKIFAQAAAARTIAEKLADAGVVHRLTGVCPSVALDIPLDGVDERGELSRTAAAHGVAIGAVSPNLFQDGEYRLGSLCHPAVAVRRRALGHVLECVEIARQLGSGAVSLWLGDGTNYPGQDDLRRRRARLVEALGEVYSALPPDMRLLIEYKFFEPSFYHTDIPDWGSAYAVCLQLGPRARILVDMGHHPSGTNIPHVAAQLLDLGRLGGFHLNARKYADDDLIAGSIDPFELFLVFNELVAAEDDPDPAVAASAGELAYMIDQSPNVEPKLEAMLQAVVNIQVAHAKALLVDRAGLREAQAAGDVLEANRVLLRAYETDVRPLLAESRRRRGLDPDPIAALRRSGYVERVARERGGARVSSGSSGV